MMMKMMGGSYSSRESKETKSRIVETPGVLKKLVFR